MQNILIIDDEPMMTELLDQHLKDCGYGVMTANSAADALTLLPKNPDLIILDINMPDMDGLTFCKKIREHISCPILFLTARVTEQAKVLGFGIGGDDYITKPFGLKELTARVAAHLRRDQRNTRSTPILTSGGLLVNLFKRQVFYQDQEIPFSKTEFDLIEFLLTNAGQVFDKERIYELVWGYDAEGNADVVKEHIRKIRAKLTAVCGKDHIDTVWGAGYKWVH